MRLALRSLVLIWLAGLLLSGCATASGESDEAEASEQADSGRRDANAGRTPDLDAGGASDSRTQEDTGLESGDSSLSDAVLEDGHADGETGGEDISLDSSGDTAPEEPLIGDTDIDAALDVASDTAPDTSTDTSADLGRDIAPDLPPDSTADVLPDYSGLDCISLPASGAIVVPGELSDDSDSWSRPNSAACTLDASEPMRMQAFVFCNQGSDGRYDLTVELMADDGGLTLDTAQVLLYAGGVVPPPGSACLTQGLSIDESGPSFSNIEVDASESVTLVTSQFISWDWGTFRVRAEAR